VSAIALALQRELPRARVIVPLWLEFTLHAQREPEFGQVISKMYRRARSGVAEVLHPLTAPGLSDAQRRGLAGAVLGAYIGLVMQEVADSTGADAGEMIAGFMSLLGDWLPGAAPIPGGEETTGARVSARELALFSREAEEPTRQRLAELRALIFSTAPDCDERVISGWRQLAYDLGGIFCSLRLSGDGVVLAFNHGARLDDPGGLLGGTGKRARSVLLGIEDPLPAGLGALVEEAIGLQRG